MSSQWNRPNMPVKTEDGKSHPCLPDCPDRGPTCHATCTRGYKEYQEQKRQESAQRQAYMDAIRCSYNGIYRNKNMRAKKKYGY
jgi:hypothetical protein